MNLFQKRIRVYLLFKEGEDVSRILSFLKRKGVTVTTSSVKANVFLYNREIHNTAKANHVAYVDYATVSSLKDMKDKIITSFKELK